MPIREYICEQCESRLERLEMVDGERAPFCHQCLDEGRPFTYMVRVISAANPQFKGEGWTRPKSYTMPKRGPKGDQ